MYKTPNKVSKCVREKKDIRMENITSTFAQRAGIGDELFGSVMINDLVVYYYY